MTSQKEILRRRAMRVRRQIRVVAGNRMRLSIYRSNQNIYAQVIDDVQGYTVSAASTLDASFRKFLKSGGGCEAATVIGKLIAERTIKAGIKSVVFDRGPYVYHGRIKALAEAAREGGLNF
ncbi:MAG: large subunit ribosomal protein L18 [Candidatus Tokpelaia sp. JSC188]|nr:MAG: large subunit ribosomal protein L18 [Candidatus Tokpelaia sp. JSC188]